MFWWVLATVCGPTGALGAEISQPGRPTGGLADLKDNRRIQRDPAAVSNFKGAFVPFCSSALELGAGGDSAAFATLAGHAERDVRLDFWRAGAIFMFLKRSTVAKLRLATRCRWDKCAREIVEKDLMQMREEGKEPFNLHILRNVYESFSTKSKRVAQKKVNAILLQLDSLWAKAQSLTEAELSDPDVVYNAFVSVPGLGPYRGKSALLFWAMKLGHMSIDKLAQMRVIPVAEGPLKAMGDIVGIAWHELRRPVVSTLVLKDILRALDMSWGRAKPWRGSLNPHELACQLCLWSRSDFGHEVTPVAAIAEAMM
jgi:hypothetical protein